MDELFRLVEVVHRRVTDIIEGIAERHRVPDRAALASVRPLLQELLATDQPLLEGFAVAVSEDTLSDATRWLECWRRDNDGNSHFIKHGLTPNPWGSTTTNHATGSPRLSRPGTRWPPAHTSTPVVSTYAR